jgi:hypothetical protein
MNPMPLLLSLLVVAYIGSLWVSGRARSYGLPSGLEFVILGVVLGPQMLGLIGSEAVAAFNPIAFVALGWLALGFGLECGATEGRQAPFRRIVLGSLLATVTATTAAATVFFSARFLGFRNNAELWIISGCIGLLCCETTRQAVRWLSERYPVKGPLSELVADVSAADAAPVLIALAVVFAWFDEPRSILGVSMPRGSTATVALGLGIALGLVAAALTRAMSRRVEWWGVLLGASLLCIGATTSMGMGGMSAMFAMGLSLRTVSHQGNALREMFARTERAVLLPALLLAGAHLVRPASLQVSLIILSAVAARGFVSILSGAIVASASRATRPAAGWLGLGMLSSGTLTMAVGFSVALRYPGTIGDTALAAAFAGTLAGELIGPMALRRALSLCGEITLPMPESEADPAQPRVVEP